MIERIAATPDRLLVTLRAGAESRWMLKEASLPGAPPAGTLWAGRVSGRQTIALARFAGRRDRLYVPLQLHDAAGRPVGVPRWATDLSRLPAHTFGFPWPQSRKGLTCPVDLDDVIRLGTRYINDNVTLGQALDLDNPRPEETIEIDGETFPIHAAYFRGLDARFKKLTDAGVNITVVLNNPVPTRPDPKNPFIHPRTDLVGAPNHLGAFNLADERGRRAYRAVLEYFARRYSRPDAKYGWITGYIVGNEIQQHWEWYNRGPVDAETFLDDYALALRTAYLAVRQAHAGIRVYVSMDHHWTASMKGDAQKEIQGDRVLEGLAARTRAAGDFPWDVAFHPYPENLFDPRFWRDRQATLSFDTPKITFRNLEVLPAFLQRPGLRCDGKPRRIILSEQGFHAAPTPKGERLQAAAYAAAYYRVRQLPLIDAFMLHRHVSHRQEGGLRLGLWAWDENSADPSAPGRKLPIWDIFLKADTPQWEEAFSFALSVVGIRDWRELDPARRIAAARPPEREAPGTIDLVKRRAQARTLNCADWRIENVEIDGRFVAALFQHPNLQGPADARFALRLPPGPRLTFSFAVGFSGPTRNGARFAVRVDGREVWGATRTEASFSSRTIDLSAWAGKAIELTLQVDALGDTGYDWACWARPTIRPGP